MLHLRPHHLIDIIRNIGHQRPLVPHDYGHAQHAITRRILDDPNQDIHFVLDADDLCSPCVHLKNGTCDDLLPQFSHPVLKQNYNNELDHILVRFFEIAEGCVLPLTEFVQLVEENLEGLIPLCTHPGESYEYRREGLMKGIKILRTKL